MRNDAPSLKAHHAEEAQEEGFNQKWKDTGKEHLIHQKNRIGPQDVSFHQKQGIYLLALKYSNRGRLS